MTVEVKQRRPLSFALKVSVTIVVLSIVLGVLLRELKTSTSLPKEGGLRSSHLEQNREVLVQVIGLPVDKDAAEQHWSHALAQTLDGRSEVLVDGGTVDVMTDAYAIEVDFVEQWKEGLKRAVYYRSKTDRIAVLALIQKTKGGTTDRTALEEARTVERICLENGVKFLVLKSVKDWP